MDTSNSITNIASALVKAQRTMGDATKGAKNPFFKSTYADLNSVREAAIPALNAQGIGVFQPTVVENGKNYVETLLVHESGEWLSSITEIKNTKGDAQGEGSGISYARRYGLQSFLNIGAVDDDGEAAQGRTYEKPTVQTVKVSSPTTPTTLTNGTSQNADSTASKVLKVFKILEAQKKITGAEFKAKYQGGKSISALTLDQLSSILSKVKTDFPTLNV